MNIRSGSARIAVCSPFRTASRNRRTAAVATKDANSRPKTKSVEEWELEYEYDQVLKGNIYKNETKLNQLAQWVNPTTFFGSSIFIYVGYLIFTKFSLAELTAYAGLVGMVVTAGNYVFKAIAETNAKLNQVPSLLAKVQYDLSTKSDRRHKATLRAINALRRA